jgi:hypothetical protein
VARKQSIYLVPIFQNVFSIIKNPKKKLESGGKEHRQYEKEKSSFSHFIFIFFTTTIVFFPKINNSG